MAPGKPTSMEYVRLGNSGLKVSKIILGCMSYGTPEWQDWVLKEEEGVKHIKAAYDAGINTFDTANVYSNGESEKILGKAIKQHNLPRDEIVVLTKVYFVVKKDFKGGFSASPNWNDENGYVNQHGLSRKHIFDSVKLSLERLQLDYIDVLQCHRFDYDTPIEETMQALHDVVQAGYVRYVGMSSCHAYQFHQMQNYAINNKLTPFISMQNHYNLIYREEEREMFPTLQLFGVGAIPWSPLARGLLTRPRNTGGTTRAKTDPWAKGYADNEGTEKIINGVEQVAKKHGASMAQVSLAWIMSRPGVTAPIVGTTSLDNLNDLLGAVHVKLTDEDKKQLEEAYQAQNLFGHM
ncbi:hypothetical protein EST38_g725 [Candolleomyces aberdarensis]|uniref:NADP-dependent oxidoreductase domain-containing protein n=1 Tax=Candolleomyces aberdarensis TaxID=2316362 RepID=A0A4V1Q5C7_9AGAR|nr:hypothetical protein EST38_g725 [Candolleomyces aberdarensis]